jgi:hypothetical protein
MAVEDKHLSPLYKSMATKIAYPGNLQTNAFLNAKSN